MFGNIQSYFDNLFFERDVNGNNWYLPNSFDGWSSYNDNLEVAQNHPILTPALLFISNLFAQAEFKIINEKTNEEVEHWLTELLKKPNVYQNRIDFLESLEFLKIARGSVAIYKKKAIGLKKIDSMYVLDVAKFTYPKTFKTPKSFRNRSEYLKQRIIYDKDGEKISIALDDLIFLYDLPNGVSNRGKLQEGTQKNMFVTGSRLDGLKQTLINTNDSLLAKNIILKTNGKELISGGNNGFPLSPDDKQEAENLFNVGYGLGKGRKRGLITKANINWKSMHVALRDLGLDESVKIDGNLIYTSLHIPKDILSLEAKKTTYNNFKESLTSFIQNDMQSMANDLSLSIGNDLLEPGLKLIGSYEHMPVMQFVQNERYIAVQNRAKALNDLLLTGVPNEVALELCGFDKNLKLNELQSLKPAEGDDKSKGLDEEQVLEIVRRESETG